MGICAPPAALCSPPPSCYLVLPKKPMLLWAVNSWTCNETCVHVSGKVCVCAGQCLFSPLVWSHLQFLFQRLCRQWLRSFWFCQLCTVPFFKPMWLCRRHLACKYPLQTPLHGMHVKPCRLDPKWPGTLQQKKGSFPCLPLGDTFWSLLDFAAEHCRCSKVSLWITDFVWVCKTSSCLSCLCMSICGRVVRPRTGWWTDSVIWSRTWTSLDWALLFLSALPAVRTPGKTGMVSLTFQPWKVAESNLKSMCLSIH